MTLTSHCNVQENFLEMLEIESGAAE